MIYVSYILIVIRTSPAPADPTSSCSYSLLSLPMWRVEDRPSQPPLHPEHPPSTGSSSQYTHGAPLVERDSSVDPRVNTNGDPRATLAVFSMFFIWLFDLICLGSRKNDNLWKCLGDIVVIGDPREVP